MTGGWPATDPPPLEEATCDSCRLDWPLDDLEAVEWTDTAGEEWERRFCAGCREREGL